MENTTIEGRKGKSTYGGDGKGGMVGFWRKCMKGILGGMYTHVFCKGSWIVKFNICISDTPGVFLCL